MELDRSSSLPYISLLLTKATVMELDRNRNRSRSRFYRPRRGAKAPGVVRGDGEEDRGGRRREHGEAEW